MVTRGLIQTVTGDIDPDDLGVTLSHEHILCDSSFRFKEAEDKTRAYGPVSIENLDWHKRNQHGSLDNFRLLDETAAISELKLFKESGGDTIIEMGNIGLCRDPEGLARISKATGVNIPARIIESIYDNYTSYKEKPMLLKFFEDAKSVMRDVLKTKQQF